MIQITPQMRILVAIEPVDFRRGIDGLAAVCKQTLQQDPFKGTLFAFRNRRATAVKVLVYDGQGFWLCHKRLSRGASAGGPPGEPAPPGRWRPTSCRSCYRPAIPMGFRRHQRGGGWVPVTEPKAASGDRLINSCTLVR